MGLLSRLTAAFRGDPPKAFEIGSSPVTSRRLATVPSITTAVNDLIRRYGTTATARSRYLCTNNPYTIAAKETFVGAFVGFGIKPSILEGTASQKATIQELWRDWVAEADADGITDFYGLQNQVAGEVFEAGEAFAVMQPVSRARMMSGVPLQIRLLPSEMLPYWNTQSFGSPNAAPGNVIDMGIEFDPAGNRVAYHFLQRHPGDFSNVDPNKVGTVRIPAAQVLHIYRPLRVGAIRGVPHALASLITLAMVDLYDDAELERKRTAALFAAFVKKPEPDDGDDAIDGTGPLGSSSSTDSSMNTFTMQPGAVVDLAPGEDITFSEPADVGQQYEAFQYRNLLRAAAGMGIPYAYVSQDLSKANSGSFRVALVDFRRRITAQQWHTIIHQMCRPVHLRFMDLAALHGLLPWSRADYLANRRVRTRVKWIPPRWDWVDPLKDAQSEKLLVDNGFKARWDVVEELGFDGPETDDRIAASQQSVESLGINLNTGAEPPPEDGQGSEEPPTPRERPTNE